MAFGSTLRKKEAQIFIGFSILVIVLLLIKLFSSASADSARAPEIRLPYELHAQVMDGPEPGGPTVDDLYHPGITRSEREAAREDAEYAMRRIRQNGGQLTLREMTSVLRAAGWPRELEAEALAIAWCESRWSPFASGDNGNSLGIFQLWYGWFPAMGYDVLDWSDPVVNASVALRVYQSRGRWGGAGGWSCAP